MVEVRSLGFVVRVEDSESSLPKLTCNPDSSKMGNSLCWLPFAIPCLVQARERRTL